MYACLSGKVALVTGAASGIGLQTCQRLYQEGAFIVGFDINEESLTAAFTQFNQDNVLTVTGNVAAPEDVEKLYTHIDNRFGRINIVIANAGISLRHAFLEISFEQWKHVIDVNLHGVFLICQAAARKMWKQQSGAIVMLGSTNGQQAYPYYADYNASKAGVISLAGTMAVELAPYVKVNAVCPGYVLTPMQRSEYTDAMLEKVNQKIPLKRHAESSEIAALIAFLVSDESTYITGQSIIIDGGESA